MGRPQKQGKPEDLPGLNIIFKLRVVSFESVSVFQQPRKKIGL